MAILNVVLDTYGSVLTKDYGKEFTTWEINLIRFGFAGIIMLICSITLTMRDRLFEKKKTETETGTGNNDNNEDTISESTLKWYQLPTSFTIMSKSAWLYVSLGVLFVTFFTPALSNYALFQITLALALTLGSVSPLYALPLTYIMQKKDEVKKRPPPSLKAYIGSLLAIGGIIILAFFG